MGFISGGEQLLIGGMTGPGACTAGPLWAVFAVKTKHCVVPALTFNTPSATGSHLLLGVVVIPRKNKTVSTHRNTWWQTFGSFRRSP